MTNTTQHKSHQRTLNRRSFLGLIGRAALVSALPMATLTACAPFEPRPFVAGQEVSAPYGCKKLRSENPLGDC